MICKLPPELIFNALYHSDPRDVVRWRTVSKWFCAVTKNDLLWRSMYANATVLRPPGPSTHQSSAYLERMLVKAVQLADSWPDRPMSEVSSVTVTLGRPLPTTTNKLVAGRWLVGCEDARRFMLHDTAAAPSQSHARMLWEHDEQVVSAWHVHPVSPVVGQSLVYVLLELSKADEAPLPWTLLEFRLHDESGDVYDSATLDPPLWARSTLSRVDLHGGHTRFLSIPTKSPRGVVFDTDTRTFYAMPGHRVALRKTIPRSYRGSQALDFRLEFTDAHVISIYRYSAGNLVQVYALPSDDDEEEEEEEEERDEPRLRLTHEGFSDERFFNVSAMHPRVDPLGVTTLRLLDHRSPYDQLALMIVDLTLPHPRPDAPATPMEVDDLGRACFPKDGINLNRYTHTCLYVDAAGDQRRMRGFLRAKRRQRAFDAPENQHVAKFTVDAHDEVGSRAWMHGGMGDREFRYLGDRGWAVERGGLVPAEWKDAVDAGVDPTGRNVSFDGLRGRLCYAHPKIKDRVVVVDVV